MTAAPNIDGSGYVSPASLVSAPRAAAAAAVLVVAAAEGMKWQVAAVLMGDTIAHVGILTSAISYSLLSDSAVQGGFVRCLGECRNQRFYIQFATDLFSWMRRRDARWARVQINGSKVRP